MRAVPFAADNHGVELGDSKVITDSKCGCASCPRWDRKRAGNQTKRPKNRTAHSPWVHARLMHSHSSVSNHGDGGPVEKTRFSLGAGPSGWGLRASGRRRHTVGCSPSATSPRGRAMPKRVLGRPVGDPEQARPTRVGGLVGRAVAAPAPGGSGLRAPPAPRRAHQQQARGRQELVRQEQVRQEQVRQARWRQEQARRAPGQRYPVAPGRQGQRHLDAPRRTGQWAALQRAR